MFMIQCHDSCSQELKWKELGHLLDLWICSHLSANDVITFTFSNGLFRDFIIKTLSLHEFSSTGNRYYKRFRFETWKLIKKIAKSRPFRIIFKLFTFENALFYKRPIHLDPFYSVFVCVDLRKNWNERESAKRFLHNDVPSVQHFKWDLSTIDFVFQCTICMYNIRNEEENLDIIENI